MVKLSTELDFILAEHVPHILWSARADGTVDYLNQFCLERMGLELSELLGKKWLNYVHPGEVAFIQDMWQQAIQTGCAYQIEFRLQVKDGSYRWHLFKANPIYDAENQLVRWVGTCIDIHELKLIDAARKEVSDRLDLAMESAQAGFWSLDLKTKLSTWDSHIFRLFGRSESSIPPAYPVALDMIHPRDQYLVKQQVEKTLQEKQDFACEYRVVWPDGSIHWVASRARLLLDAEQESSRLIGFCWNIDELKKTQLWKQAHQIELAQVAKLSSLREIASRLAHELNQPLTAISTYLEGCLGLLNSADCDYLVEPLQKANLQARRAGEIVHRMKDFVRQLRLQCESTDLARLLIDTVELMSYESELTGTQFEYEFASDIPLLDIDRLQLQQVVINLLRNSLEAMSDARVEKPSIKILTRKISRQIEVAIQDNGPGITSEALGKLFSPYYTTKPYGTGLGLPICQSIIEAHGGSFICFPQPAHGAVLKFTLPITDSGL